MFKLRLHFLKHSINNKHLLFYDGPDFNSKHYTISGAKTILFASFQCSVIFQVFDDPSEIDIAFQIAYLRKDKRPNYKSILVTEELILQQSSGSQQFLSAYKLFVSSASHVNITISSFNFSGSNIGYCKYGGISIYE